jgi:hypothetical protein
MQNLKQRLKPEAKQKIDSFATKRPDFIWVIYYYLEKTHFIVDLKFTTCLDLNTIFKFERFDFLSIYELFTHEEKL